MQSLYEKLMNRMHEEMRTPISGLKQAPKKIVKKKFKFKPFITISREPGSGGKPVAKKLARLTGFKYYNKKLIEKVARSTRMRGKLLESIDEKGRSTVQDLVHSIFNPDYVSDTKYIKHLCNVILFLAEKGNVILLGRGSNFITPGDRGLHVRISAPYPVRVERAIKYEKVSSTVAKNRIKKIDADRRSYIKQYFNMDISNANFYDLVLNTTYTTIENATQIILKSFELKFPGYLRSFKIQQKRSRKKK